MSRLGATARALLVAVSLATAAPAAGGGPRVAVLGAAPGAAVPPSAAAAVVAAAVEAVRRSGLEVVEPGVVGRAIASAGGDPNACGGPCAISACAAVGADALLVVKLSATGANWYVDARLRDGRRGSVRSNAAASVGADEVVAAGAALRLATQVVQALGAPGGGPPPVAGRIPEPPPPARAEPPVAVRAPEPLPAPDMREPAAAPLQPRPPPADPVRRAVLPAEPPRGAERAPGAARRTWGNVLLAGGAALLAGGAVTGALAWSQSNGASSALARGDLGSFAVGRQTSRTLTVGAAGLGAVGALTAGAGAWLRLGGRPVAVTVEAGPERTGARVAVAF